jgi:hypothetical protein
VFGLDFGGEVDVGEEVFVEGGLGEVLADVHFGIEGGHTEFVDGVVGEDVEEVALGFGGIVE